MTRQELENWVISKGYSKDKFGHYTRRVINAHLEDGIVTTRFKMQSNSVRYEKQIEVSDYKDGLVHEWMKLAGGYYKNLSITPEGKLSGMKR